MPDRKRRPILLLLLLLWPPWLHAENHPCQQEPTARCLISTLLQEWPALTQAGMPHHLAAHLAFEAQQLKLKTPPFTPDGQQQKLLRQLEQEEQFVQHLQRQQWQAAERMLPLLPTTLQDYWHSPPQALLLEALILGLQDERAEHLKRAYYATLLTWDETRRAEHMLAVARHEILGGQPDKGQQTLMHSDVDAFSPSAFFLARRSTELLADRSRQLFLQPDKGIQHCSEPADIGPALHQWLSDRLQLASMQHQLPDFHTRIALQLSFARLYHNSAQCSLLTQWFQHQAILLATQLPDRTVDAILQRIFIARTVRRYL